MRVLLDLVVFFTRGNFVEVLCEKSEGLKIVLRQLVKQFLQFEHSTLPILHPIHSNYTLVQLCK